MKKKIMAVILLIYSIFLPINVLAYSDKVYVGGSNIGIKINNSGILIVGFYKVNDVYNEGISELVIGDIITKVNGEDVLTIDELVSAIDKHMQDDKVTLSVKRNETNLDIDLGLKLVNNSYKTGLYVKDSLTGIGTMTYIDPETSIYGALGHEVIESTTSKRIEVRSGNIYSSYVTGINKSSDGEPGGKNAKIDTDDELGSIKENTKYGIFGIYDADTSGMKLFTVAKPDEIHKGNATIYTVIDGNEIKEYEIEITKIDDKNDIKNIHFEIKDQQLLKTTGGVVQGMSGSPIIQDGKIIGAVTHVVIDNVKTGYGIFITTMLEEGEN